MTSLAQPEGLSLSVLVECAPGGEGLSATLDSLARQTQAPAEILLLDDGTLPGPTLCLLEALARRPGVRRLPLPGGATRGAWRNLAVGASRGEAFVFLSPGERLRPRFVERAAARLSSEGRLGALTPRAEGGPGPESSALGVAPSLLWRAETMHPASVLRRAAFTRAGGFDEQLGALEWLELWLRMLSQGEQAEVLVAALEPRELPALPAEPPLARETAFQRILERHLEALAAETPSLLWEKERRLREEAARRAEHLARRSALEAELGALKATRAAHLAYLEAEGASDVDFGELRRVDPVSREWGYERGKPVDRHYIEAFLRENAEDIRGRVLEVQEAGFTHHVGGERVSQSDVVDFNPQNPGANVITDLRRCADIPDGTYDCFILTQTVHVIDDMRAVLAEAHRVLKPGGVLLVTFPAASRVCLEYGPDGDFWRVTEAGARVLFQGLFEPEKLTVQGYGNVLVGTAFLYGLGAHEVSKEEFETYDPYYPLVIGVRAQKRAAPRRANARPEYGRGAILLYHRVAEAKDDPYGLCLPPAELERQLRYLKEHCLPLPLDTLLQMAAEGRIPERAVALTFDDGYLDNLSHASPLLVEAEVPATFYVLAGGEEGLAEFWWDALAELLLLGAPTPAELSLEVSGEPLRFSTRSASERGAAHQRLYAALQRARPEEQRHVVGKLREWSGLFVRTVPEVRPMTGHELRRLADRPGHQLASHGRHHLALPYFSKAQVAEELALGKAALEALLGRPVTSFAYPFGALSTPAIDAARAAGFGSAVTCEEGLVSARADLFRLPRIEVRAKGPRLEHLLQARFASPVAPP